MSGAKGFTVFLAWAFCLGSTGDFASARKMPEDFLLFSKNVSGTLDQILAKDNYDKRIRPNFGGPPIQVGVNMYIKSIGPVSENEEMYTMDVYFRQTWFDRRLRFEIPGVEEISMSWVFLEKIWKPDTYFTNGKKSYLHRITSPNKFLRIRNDGFLTYSMRLTISARCRMHLRKFPLDSQKCPLVIGSYGYSAQDLVYRWTDNAVLQEPGLEMAQYDLVNISIRSQLFAMRGHDEYSVIEAEFHLRRTTGYFILQIYIPCSLIVCSSWVSFWINPTDVAGRVSLAVTTVLSITTMGFGGRAQLPKVSYATALDWFIIFCFSFAFAVMVEYAVINFTDKLVTDIRRILEERAKRKKSSQDRKDEEEKERQAQEDACTDTAKSGVKIRVEYADENGSDSELEERPQLDPEIQRRLMPRRWFSVPTITFPDSYRPTPWAQAAVPESSDSCDSVTGGPRLRRFGFSFREKLLMPVRYWKSVHFLPREEDVDLEEIPVHKFSKIDIAARKLFPLSFATFLATYFLMYTFYIKDKLTEDE